jgi:RND family efflux transporter MFP subunit
MVRRVQILLSASLLGVAATGYAFRTPLAGSLSNPRGAPESMSARAAAREVWTCPMHPDLEAHERGRCAVCGMDLVPLSSTAIPSAAGARIHLDSRRQQLIGVRLTPVTRAIRSRSLRATGIVRPDETRQYEISLQVDGWIRRLFGAQTGQLVRRGEPLLAVYSPSLLAGQQEYIVALKARDDARAATFDLAREQAVRLAAAARQRLTLLGLSEADITTLETQRTPSSELTFASSQTGHVVERLAVDGMHIVAGQTLFRLVDLSTVWLEVDVPERDLALARPGTSARVTVDAYPGQRLVGRVVAVLPVVDENSRTGRIRFTFANPQLRLRPGMFANVEWQGLEVSGLAVPLDAILDAGSKKTVFVGLGDGYFEPRPVETGRTFDDSTMEILKGLTEGEHVVSGATFLIDAESQVQAALDSYAGASPLTQEPAVDLSQAIAVELRTDPDPPRTGPTPFEVSLASAGTPVTDASVRVVISMPAMPAMNMPAMRADRALAHVGGGIYRATIDIGMSGRWDVAITAWRHGQPLMSTQRAILVR